MIMRYLFKIGCLSTLFWSANLFAQTIQISTEFHTVAGKPVWLLIVRDVESGAVSPYLFDVDKNEHFWTISIPGRHYRITASTLKFGAYAVIHNFCHLESDAPTTQSITLTLSGDLTPDPASFKCKISKYNSGNF